MTNERLIYLPLGGAGEIGMNAYVYGWGAPGEERFLIVDLGVTFPSMDGTPGVDLIIPDLGWIVERAARVEGILLTHAHEDHIGALGMIYDQINAPIYARKFTAQVAQAKLESWGCDAARALHIAAPYPEMQKIGPFGVGFMPVSHSIPEASALVIDTPAGRVIHSGDLKLDPNPVVGEPLREDQFQDCAKGGIKAFVCDSTNVFSPNAGRSEGELAPAIGALVRSAKGLMVATTFASNVARVMTLAQAGEAAGRSVCVLGRSMQRMLGYAQDAEVLPREFPPLLSLEEAQLVARENLMLIVTGSQGERRAASAQLAQGKYLGFSMQQDDMFLFSSKTIPGNEVAVARIINDLVRRGVHVIDDASGKYHVSGHANRPDLCRLHEMFDPEWIIPMHGEARHLAEHVRLASDNGRNALCALNGALVNLSASTPYIEDHVEAGRVYLDGSEHIGAYDGIVLERMRMAMRGLVVASLLLEGDALSEVSVETIGLADPSHGFQSLAEFLEDVIENEIRAISATSIMNDEALSLKLERCVAAATRDAIGKKPVTRIMINR